ncbi:MAG: ACT domain-containing protein, partial [Candidatus Omnitrophica bacterium]|nr:ACT domain-containing protein [Candidatus Omnitrophota bacterium]
NVSKENYADISFTVNITEVEKTMKIMQGIANELNAEYVTSDTDIAKVSIIGIGMMNHPGVAGRMFETLARENINIEMISTSEIKISCVVKKSDGVKALKALHKEFIQ